MWRANVRACAILCAWALALLVAHASAGNFVNSQYTVSQLLGFPGWVNLSSPSYASNNCTPGFFELDRQLQSGYFIFPNNVNSYNFVVFDRYAPTYVWMNVLISNALGVERIDWRTGPRSTGQLNLQQPLWAYLAPELEIFLTPRNGQLSQIQPVVLDIIWFFTSCQIDVQNTIDWQNAAFGMQSQRTKGMKMAPLSAYLVNGNKDVNGNLALHAQIKGNTAGINRFLLTRTADPSIASFNLQQGNSDQYTYGISVYSVISALTAAFIVICIIILLLVDIRGNANGRAALGAQLSATAAQNAKITKQLAELMPLVIAATAAGSASEGPPDFDIEQSSQQVPQDDWTADILSTLLQPNKPPEQRPTQRRSSGKNS